MDTQPTKTQSTLRTTTLDYSSFRSKFFSSHQCHQYHYYYSQYYSQPRLTHVNFFERIMKKEIKEDLPNKKKKTKPIVKEEEKIISPLSYEAMDKILTDNQIEYGDGDELTDDEEKFRKVSPLFTSNDSLFSSSSSHSSIYSIKSSFSSSSLSIQNKNNNILNSKLWSPSSVSSSTTKSSRSSIEDLEWEPILSNENIYDRLCDYNTNLMDSLKLTHIQSLSENDLLFCSNNKSSGYGTTTSQSMDSMSSCEEEEEEKSMCSRIMKGSQSYMSCQSFNDDDDDETISLAQTSTSTSSSLKRESSDLKYVLVLFEQNKSKSSSSKVSRVYTNSPTSFSSSSSSTSHLSVNEKSFFSKNRKKNGSVSISMKIKGY